MFESGYRQLLFGVSDLICGRDEQQEVLGQSTLHIGSTHQRTSLTKDTGVGRAAHDRQAHRPGLLYSTGRFYPGIKLPCKFQPNDCFRIVHNELDALKYPEQMVPFGGFMRVSSSDFASYIK